MDNSEIFKFVSLRAPQPVDRDTAERGFVARKGGKTRFHARIAEMEAEDNREKAIGAAAEFLDSSAYFPDVSELVALVSRATSSATAGDARQVLEDGLDASLEDYLASDTVSEVRESLWDSIYAQSLVPEKRPVDRDDLFAGARAFHFVDLVAASDADDPVPSQAALERMPIRIPKDLFHPPGPGSNLPANPIGDLINQDVGKLLEKLDEMDSVVTDIRNLDRVYRRLKQREVTVGVKDLPDTDFGQQILFRSVDAPLLMPTNAPFLSGIDASRGERPRRERAALASMTVEVPRPKSWLESDFGRERLGKVSQKLLKARHDDFNESSPQEVAEALESEKFNEAQKVLSRYRSADIRQADPALLDKLASKVNLPFMEPKSLVMSGHMPGSSPAERGIQPLGVGDLLVVRQELRGYTRGELAHIENVMKSERRGRFHTRENETETTVVIEHETTEETERDLQTTERFELQRESEKTIQSEMSMGAGMSVSASYGAVTASANADFSYSQSRSESQRNASTFARDVTSKSVSRIQERAREERTRRTLEKVREHNEHEFDNTSGNGHVRGLYCWLDKQYRARVINYGRRLMLEFMIPEPAAFYLYCDQAAQGGGVTMDKPRAPRVNGSALRPEHLDRGNVDGFIAEYGVQDIPPYPETTIRLSAAAAQSFESDSSNTAFGMTIEKLEIPNGYQGVNAYGRLMTHGIEDSGFYAKVLIGGRDLASANAEGLEGLVPISVFGWGGGFNVSVVVECELTDEARRQWQLDAYAAIMNAYENRLMAYNEQVAAAQVQSMGVAGRNPAINRRIINEELRKGALRQLTEHFSRIRVSGEWYYNEQFSAMSDFGYYGFPEFHVNEALKEGKIVQFFENAFEWQNMTYALYPYFWGRKPHWPDTYSRLDDPDTQFVDFLRSGSARVVVPAHPAYAEALLHYLSTSEIWNGGEPPTLDDPMHVAIADELRAQSETELGEGLPACTIDGGFPCVVDEWDVTLPTSLVYLQEDSTLAGFEPGES